MVKVNSHTPLEIGEALTASGVAKAKLSLDVYIIKSFLGGVFISLGGLADLVVVSGCYGLRESNPTIATMIGGFLFPVGFILILLTGQELCTSNMFVMTYTTLQRKTTVLDLAKNWVITYIGNILGCLFVAGFLAYWTDTFSLDLEKSYVVSQANDRVNVGWSVNLLRGVGCNLFVAMATFLALGSVEFVSKIYGIWIPIWIFVMLGYQHCIANFFMVPIGMMQGGAAFGVGKFIYQSVVPVTLGNVIGAALLAGVPFWWMYGRVDQLDLETGQAVNVERKGDRNAVGRASGGGGRSSSDETVAGGSGAGDAHTARAYG